MSGQDWMKVRYKNTHQQKTASFCCVFLVTFILSFHTSSTQFLEGKLCLLCLAFERELCGKSEG